MIFISMTKLIITTKQFNILREHLEEEIDPSEASEDSKALDTVINKKRNVAFLISRGKYGLDNLKKAVDAGLGVIKFNQDNNPNKLGYMVYNHGYEKQAQELANIAIKWDGYLPCAPDQGISADEVFRIGRLLGYNRDSVVQFVCDKFNLSPNYFKDINIYP